MTPTSSPSQVLAAIAGTRAIRAVVDAEAVLVASTGDGDVVCIHTFATARDEMIRRVDTCSAAISAGLEAGERSADQLAARLEINRLTEDGAPWRRHLLRIGNETVEVQAARLLGGESGAFGSGRGLEFSIGTTAALDSLQLEFVQLDALPVQT